eukprot:scpid56496/ scgid32897/ Nischarin; Imidazoline receptor 1; Imidazoline receptor antisera-selected protein; Imidazoline-1 receptor; Imidazoline-1 receptor candidate protein
MMTSLRASRVTTRTERGASSTWHDQDQENRVRHVVIREAEIVKQPSTHVVYKINVLTQWNHWCVLRRYSEFFQLHTELVQRYGIAKDLLPPKRLTGNLDPKVIESRREALEHYLQRLVNSHFEVATSKVLSLFLDVQSHDVIQVAKRLARRAFEEGEVILSNRRPIQYTPTEMFCICKRLKLPMADGDNTDGGATDLSHLYSFINQLEALSIAVPAGHPSSCNMPFSLAQFRSLRLLNIDTCPLALLEGLSTVCQQVRRLGMHHNLNSLKSVLEDAAIERRGPSAVSTSLSSSGVDSWRHSSIVSLTVDRPVMQQWTHLTHLDVSRNRITALDDSLRLLPALQEANFSFNMIQSLDFDLLCVGHLKKANFAHNQISTLTACKQEFRPLHELNLGHNRLKTLTGLEAFTQLRSIFIDHNLVASHTELAALSDLGQLRHLQLAANPFAQRRGYRVGALAMVPHCVNVVAIDGTPVSLAEQARLDKLSQQHGNDSRQWPENALRRTGSFSSVPSTPVGGHPPLSPRRSDFVTPTSSQTKIHVSGERLDLEAAVSALSTPGLSAARLDQHSGVAPGSSSHWHVSSVGQASPSSSTSGHTPSPSGGAAAAAGAGGEGSNSRNHVQAGVSSSVSATTLSAEQEATLPATGERLPATSTSGTAGSRDSPFGEGGYRVVRVDSEEPPSEDFTRNPFNEPAMMAQRDHFFAARSWSPPGASAPQSRPQSSAADRGNDNGTSASTAPTLLALAAATGEEGNSRLAVTHTGSGTSSAPDTSRAPASHPAEQSQSASGPAYPNRSNPGTGVSTPSCSTSATTTEHMATSDTATDAAHQGQRVCDSSSAVSTNMAVLDGTACTESTALRTQAHAEEREHAATDDDLASPSSPELGCGSGQSVSAVSSSHTVTNGSVSSAEDVGAQLASVQLNSSAESQGLALQAVDLTRATEAAAEASRARDDADVHSDTSRVVSVDPTDS